MTLNEYAKFTEKSSVFFCSEWLMKSMNKKIIQSFFEWNVQSLIAVNFCHSLVSIETTIYVQYTVSNGDQHWKNAS